MKRTLIAIYLCGLLSALVACQDSAPVTAPLNEAQKDAERYDNSLWEVRGVESMPGRGLLLVLINRRANAQEMFLFSPTHRDYSKLTTSSLRSGDRVVFKFTREDQDQNFNGNDNLKFIRYLRIDKAQ